MNLDEDDFNFSLPEASFSINDESTWGDGMVSVGYANCLFAKI